MLTVTFLWFSFTILLHLFCSCYVLINFMCFMCNPLFWMITFIVYLSVRCCLTTSLYFIFLGFSRFDLIHYSRSVGCRYYIYKYVLKKADFYSFQMKIQILIVQHYCYKMAIKMIHAVKTYSLISSPRSKKFFILCSHYLILLSLLVYFVFILCLCIPMYGNIFPDIFKLPNVYLLL